MKGFNKFFVAILGITLIAQADTSYAAFGGSRAKSSGSGVSRSYSRPSTPKTSYSKPSSTYNSKPSYNSNNSYNTRSNYNSNSNYRSNGSSNYNGYNYNQPRQRSAMGDIGVGVASVAGGILAAEAIKGLISGPSGTFTHPQYPGQVFNAQGVPMAGPSPQTQPASQVPLPADQQFIPPAEQGAAQQGQQPIYVVTQPVTAKEGGGFFSFLWNALGNILHLILYLGVVGAIVYGGWKAYGFLKRKYKKEKANMLFDVESEFDDLDAEAMNIFYDFQKNSDNKDWVKRNTKYMSVDDCLSPPSKVLKYEHKVLDAAVEQDKLRASVQYNAILENTEVEDIHQIWNFEKDVGVWKLIGIEVV